LLTTNWIAEQIVRIRLDPDEALGGPLYAVAALLILIPAAEVVFTIPPPVFANVRWRFEAVSLVSSNMLMPVVGLALALVVSGMLGQPRVQRVLVYACLTIALGLAAVSFGFMRDVQALRLAVPLDESAAFRSAWMRSIIKLLLSMVVLAYLGWKARQMIPATSRHKSPTGVHVITK